MPTKSHLPAVAAGVVVIALTATAIATAVAGEPSESPAAGQPARPTATPSAPESAPRTWRDQPDLPLAVDGDLWVGGEQVPGEWYGVTGHGTRWLSVRADRTWWWGHDAQPQRIEGEVDQGPAISPSGRYLAYVVGDGPVWTLAGADTEAGGEGFGTVDLPRRRMAPAPRAVAVTDDGLVVAGGPFFQWVWRPLADGGIVDLAETAPGQVVLDSTAAGLVVNEGAYGRVDRNEGAPYLAHLSADGTLTPIGGLPRHDVLEASERWLAYAPPGTIGGEAWATGELRVQRLDGSGAGVLTAPEGWWFAAPGFRWETPDRLVALLMSPDYGSEALARCRPDRMTCALVDVPD